MYMELLALEKNSLLPEKEDQESWFPVTGKEIQDLGEPGSTDQETNWPSVDSLA